METLQLAQMLADLSSLNAAENRAADALVTANKAIENVERDRVRSPSEPKHSADDMRRASSAQGVQQQQQQQYTTTASSPSSPPAAAAARVDKFGRRILMSPPMSRGGSNHGSGAGTPRRESDVEADLDRASTLMALYEIRAKLKQQDNSSLIKAREKIAELAARQQGKGKGQGQAQQHTGRGSGGGGKRDSGRYLYPK